MRTNADMVGHRTPTATATADSIPISDASGKLDGWVTVAFTKSFESTQQTITAAGPLTLAHGLGASPKGVSVVLVCQTAELNYSQNDEVFINIAQQSTSANDSHGVSVVPDAINLNIKFGNSVTTFVLLNKTTGAGAEATNANWKIVFRAWV